MTNMSEADIVIIGSGIGGSTLAHSLADTGRRIVILERGEHLLDTPQARDDVAIFQQGFYKPTEQWLGTDGKPFRAENYYYVGGNSKFYGAVMYRYRVEDFEPRDHMDGSSPGWDMKYPELEPWYEEAEYLFRVRGSAGEDPTDPPRKSPFPFPPVPDEASIVSVRERLLKAGMHPSSLPLAIDIEEWLKRANTGWDSFPNTGKGKIDAEAGPLANALRHDNVSLVTGAQVMRLETDDTGTAVQSAVYVKDGSEHRITAPIFAVAAGAIQSAVLLLRSANTSHPTGLGNRSDQVGRNFMNHNLTAMLAVDPFSYNSAVYQKTLTFNDFYNRDPETGFPLGNIQLFGRLTENILKAQLPLAPGWAAKLLSNHSFGWLIVSEDLPSPESRVMVRDGQIVMNWVRTNMRAHQELIKRARKVMRKAGFPIVLTKMFDNRLTAHQCGTARLGTNPATSVVDLNCLSHDVNNMYVTDASVLPTSAAVNPALTVAALALKAGANIKNRWR